jgi:hypothetical protein
MILENQRFGVKIILYDSKTQCIKQETIYYNSGFTFHHFHKWRWFFRYRCALYQVKYKSKYVELITFKYEFVPTTEQEIKRISDKLRGAKGTATKYRNKMDKIINNWTQIFPYKDHPDFCRADNKVKTYENKVIELGLELEKLKAL